mmetsp:Transcript_24269/g.40752  ORF Transcript_24269/g.40752 Transcript_24269/m.40752 type:complete len:134 (-) Transcript_24269:566-967(-)
MAAFIFSAPSSTVSRKSFVTGQSLRICTCSASRNVNAAIRAETAESDGDSSVSVESSEDGSMFPAEMADFEKFKAQASKTKRRFNGYTYDRESGMQNTWAIEPKMYVDESSSWNPLKAIGSWFSGSKKSSDSE